MSNSEETKPQTMDASPSFEISEIQWKPETSEVNYSPVEMAPQWNENATNSIQQPSYPVTSNRYNPSINAQQNRQNSFIHSNMNNFDPRFYQKFSHISNPLNRFCVPNVPKLIGTQTQVPPNFLPPNFNGLPHRNVIPSGVNGWVNQATSHLIRSKVSNGSNPTGKPVVGKKQKRVRTAFTTRQMMDLEQEFANNRYIDRNRRTELSTALHLNERVIKIWFQNRRMKEKKDKLEELEEAEASSTTTPDSPDYTPAPIIIHDAAGNELYSHDAVYVDSYSAGSSIGHPVHLAPPPQQNSNSSSAFSALPGLGVVPSYPEYITEEQALHYQQLQVQMQHYPPNGCSGGLQQIAEEPEPPSVSMSPKPSQSTSNNNSNAVDQNWDLTWIRSIELNDDC